MTKPFYVDHEQAVIEKCLEHFSEAPSIEKLSNAVGRWLRFGPKKSLAIKLHDADDGGYVYIMIDHVSGEKVKGCTALLTDRKPLTAEKLHKIRLKRIDREAKQRERAFRKSELLSTYAAKIWHKATKPANEKVVFKYLARKGEPVPKNVRFYRSHKRYLMLLPMVCPFDNLKSLYLIDEKGFKRPLKGTATKGLMMAISNADLALSPVLWVVEGYVTGLSLFNAMNQPVVVAFTSGNLLPVVTKLVQAYPKAKLKLCADNDLGTLEKRGFNPGVDAAKKVQAEFPQVEIFIPEFPEGSTGLSDFNDLVQHLNRQDLQRLPEGE